VFNRSNGNLITVSDPDAGSAPVVLTLATDRGYQLQLAQTTGLINLSEVNPIQYLGSIADLNAALDGLRLIPPASGGEANTFVRITTDDQGNTGVGGPQSDVDTIPVAFTSNPIVLSVDDLSITEGQSGTTEATFVVTLAGRQTDPVSVDYATADGTATAAGGDYVSKQGTLVFDGQRQKTITVLVNGDTAIEPDEQFVLNLSNVKGALIGDGEAVGTITNDDAAAAPAFSISDAAPVTEGNAGTTSATFTVTLAAPAAGTLSVDYMTSNGNASAPADYTPVSGTLTFQPGEVSKTIVVAVKGDTIDEADEPFHIVLSNPQGGAVPITRGSASATILDDDDPPVVSVSDASLAEGNSGTTQMTFTLTLSAASEKSLAVSISSTNGTAQAGVDFGGPGGSIVFVPGETSKTVNVGVFGDTTPEPDETFFFDLSSPFEVTIGDGVGVGTIVNDDGPVAGPKVTQVYVAGSAWSAAYKQFLQASGKGDGIFGYAMPAGAAGAQLAVLPSGNLDQLSVRFDSDVLVLGSDLDLRGVAIAGGHYAVSAFVYDDATHTATWTLTQPLRGDKLLLDLDGDADGVADANTGALLDGDWASGSNAYPSGDGSAGGDLRYRLNVLTGDVNGNGSVSLLDWVQERLRTSRSIANPGAGTFAYGPLYDLNGDGKIDDADMRLIRRNLLRSLPAAAPAALPPSVAAPAPPPALGAALAARRAATRDSTATADLFSASPILG